MEKKRRKREKKRKGTPDSYSQLREIRISYLILEAGDLQDLKYGVQRIIGSGSNGSVRFTMSSGGQDGYSFILRWNEEAATLESFDQRVFCEEGSEILVWIKT